MSLNIFSFSLLVRHNSEIFHKVKCNKTKTKISNKNLESWSSQMINLATCWVLQLTLFYYTPNFVGNFLLLYRTSFCIIWQKFLVLKLVRERILSKNTKRPNTCLLVQCICVIKLHQIMLLMWLCSICKCVLNENIQSISFSSYKSL